MKKMYAMLVALVVTLFASNVLAFTPPASPAPVSWISDTSGVLTPAAHARLDAKLKQINQSSANEIAALILPTLDGADIADVGDLTAKSWGVGKKGLDNGVLVVLAMKEHKSRISTGKGVEGDLPDLKANDILVAARPYLRKGDVEGALGFIFDSTSSTIANHKAELAAGKSGSSSRPSCQVSSPGSEHSSGIFLLAVVLGLGGLMWYLAHSTRRRRLAEEERERQAREGRMRLRQQQIAEREAQRKRDEEVLARHRLERERLQREAELKKTTSTPDSPIRPVAIPRPTPQPTVHHHVDRAAAAAAAITVSAAAEDAARKRRAEEEAARKRRERDEEDRRRRAREEEDDRRRRDSYSSSSSSSSSFDWGGSSGGGSGGFGGGDSGGGGSSGDW